MANMSDVLMSKLESIPWLYSIDCQIHGRDSALLIKYVIEDDFYAVMVTDLTLIYFECLEGKDIDDHYRRFNKGEIKRERLLSHLRAILSDVTKVKAWRFETLTVDCHTSRLTLKVQNQLSILKFEWSFYMISTNPETLSRHLTFPLLRLISSLKIGIDLLRKEVNHKDKQIDDNNGKTDSQSDNELSDESLVKKIVCNENIVSLSCSGTDDNSLLINNLINDNVLSSLSVHLHNSDKSYVTDVSDESSINNTETLETNKDNNSEEGLTKRREIDSQLSSEDRRQTTRPKKLKS